MFKIVQLKQKKNVYSKKVSKKQDKTVTLWGIYKISDFKKILIFAQYIFTKSNDIVKIVYNIYIGINQIKKKY